MDLGFNLAQGNRDLKDPTIRQIFGDTSGLLCKNDPILRHICFNPHGGTRLKYLSDILMNTFQAMIQLKVLGDGLHLWYKQAGAYWIKVPPQQHMN